MHLVGSGNIEWKGVCVCACASMYMQQYIHMQIYEHMYDHVCERIEPWVLFLRCHPFRLCICVFVSMCGCVSMYVCGGPNRTQAVLLYNYLPYSFEIRYLTECHTISHDVCMEVR